jgi:hypothetical protein
MKRDFLSPEAVRVLTKRLISSVPIIRSKQRSVFGDAVFELYKKKRALIRPDGVVRPHAHAIVNCTED